MSGASPADFIMGGEVDLFQAVLFHADFSCLGGPILHDLDCGAVHQHGVAVLGFPVLGVLLLSESDKCSGIELVLAFSISGVDLRDNRFWVQVFPVHSPTVQKAAIPWIA